MLSASLNIFGGAALLVLLAMGYNVVSFLRLKRRDLFGIDLPANWRVPFGPQVYFKWLLRQ